VISDRIAVDLSSWMNRLFSGGSISTMACGKITRRIRCTGEKFSAIAPSYCARGTDCTAPRTISAP
jgi:hypothetical protein